jgi:hypothetical protein
LRGAAIVAGAAISIRNGFHCYKAVDLKPVPSLAKRDSKGTTRGLGVFAAFDGRHANRPSVGKEATDSGVFEPIL